MKIYEFNYKGDKDWVFAPNKKEAIGFYKGHIGCTDLEGTEISSIPKSRWKDMYLLDINELEPDSDEVEYNEEDYDYGYKIMGSFAEYAEKNTSTDIIATTVY